MITMILILCYDYAYMILMIRVRGAERNIEIPAQERAEGGRSRHDFVLGVHPPTPTHHPTPSTHPPTPEVKNTD